MQEGSLRHTPGSTRQSGPAAVPPYLRLSYCTFNAMLSIFCLLGAQVIVAS